MTFLFLSKKIKIALDKAGACVLGSMTSMATVSLEEKRLKALKQQLFGKSVSTPAKVTGRQFKDAMNSHQATVSATTLQSINLKSDIMKIIVLSFLAIAIQLSLFFANQNGLIKLFN